MKKNGPSRPNRDVPDRDGFELRCPSALERNSHVFFEQGNTGIYFRGTMTQGS